MVTGPHYHCRSGLVRSRAVERPHDGSCLCISHPRRFRESRLAVVRAAFSGHRAATEYRVGQRRFDSHEQRRVCSGVLVCAPIDLCWRVMDDWLRHAQQRDFQISLFITMRRAPNKSLQPTAARAGISHFWISSCHPVIFSARLRRLWLSSSR